MNKLINKLPTEVINIIISYTYKPQPIQLRNDIISYLLTKDIIINIFKKRYVDYTTDVIKSHLSFHLFNFLTGVKNLYSECTNKLSLVSKRNYMLNTKNTNITYNIGNYFSKKNVNSIFNIYWGLVTPEERNQFITIQIKMDAERQP